MIHFLVIYDQSAGRVLLLEQYPDDERAAALDRRFALEREHADDQNLEIIVLSAPSRADLELTHARYFKDVQGLASS